MKKSVYIMILLILFVLVFSSAESKISAIDFSSDYFSANNVEITPNSTIPENTNITDYRYGIKLSSSKENSMVKINNSFFGKFSIDMMVYSSVTFSSNLHETSNYSNTYQDLNTFSINFKNKKDSKEFKLVLDGGAKGSNVTVNAHVEANDQKMGLYYSKTNQLVGNTKGANALDIYTFLWGTSFSNVAVGSEEYSSENVKSLKLEFDPITMCIYGYSYGYSIDETTKLLIWDFSKTTIDGSDEALTLSSFDEYEVSIAYESINSERNANIIIYSINEQNLSNTIISNNIGPTSFVKLSNGKISENYYLPKPKAYDVLDGKIEFNGTVEVLDSNNNKVDLYLGTSKRTNNEYIDGVYFIPSISGKYTISYVGKDLKNVNGINLSQIINVSLPDDMKFVHNLSKTIYLKTNATFTIPTCNFKVNDDTYPTIYKVYSPNNKLLSVNNSFKLEDVGVYKLVYSSVVNNITYEDVIEIYSSYESAELFEQNNCLSVEYGNMYLNKEINGVVVKTNSESSNVQYINPLDIKCLDGNTCLLSMKANPIIWGSNTFTAITVKLIDAADENNYVRIFCSTSANSDTSLVRAGSNTQRLAGLTSDGTVAHTSSNGTTILHSFSAIANYKNLIDQNFELYFDYQSKKIYTTNKKLVADLDDSEYFSTLWNGFSSNRFYIQISISGINGEASYIINKVVGYDLSNELYLDKNAPILSYDDKLFIDGLVDVYYPIPNVDSIDSNSNTTFSTIEVFLNDKKQEINDGKFLPSEIGRYVIIYNFYDNFGNKTILTKRIIVKESIPDIELSVDTTKLYGKVGEVQNLPTYTVTGGSGEISVKIMAVGINKGVRYEVKNFKFKPLVEDTYIITYNAYDLLGNSNENTVNLEVDISLSDKPIIEIPSFVPTVLIDGNSTEFASTKAFDYNNQNNPEVEVELYLDINGIETKINDYKHMISLDSMNGVAILKYKATSNITNQTAILSYEIPTIKLYDANGNLNISQYLVTNGIDNIELTDNSINLSTSTSNSTIEFIKNVYSDGFQISFNVPSSANNLDKVTIYLADAIDQDKQIKLDIIKAKLTESFSYLLINDEVRVLMAGTFYGTTANRLKIVYDGTLNAIKDDSGLVIAYLKNYFNGDSFAGFSPEINFKIQLGNVTGPTLINLFEIGNQLVSNIDGDYTVPAIIYESELVRNSKINSIVKIPSATAIDILGFSTTLTIKVLSPSKEVIYTSNQGIGTSINVNEYGTYYVYYIGSDDSGNQLNQLKIITVLDDIAPVITLNGEVKTQVKVNDKLTLPSCTVTDNVSKLDNISTIVFCIDPNNVMKVVDNTITFDLKGKYIIRYFAIDEAGNISFIDHLVEVI